MTYTLATPANMKRLEHDDRSAGVFAFDLDTGNRFSATSGDYWNHPEHESLKNEAGNPLILVRTRTLYLDAITGETI